MLALRAVLRDPSSSLAISGSTNDFDEPFVNNLAGIRTLMATWSNKPPEDVRREAAWTKATNNAEKVVPSLYGRQCSITSVKVYDAAPIVDLQAFKGIGEESLTVWRHLRVFWPALEKIQTFDIFGKELENILPLSPTAHRLWHINKAGLRPIPHPNDPNSIYLQVVWFQNYHNDIGWSKPVSPPIDKDLRDTRREVVDSATQLSGCQYILHGDVYEFRTTSATTRPLPNLRFLQLRYAVQKLFAGVQAAGEALEKPSGREEEPPNVTNSGPSVEKNLRMTPTQTPALVRGRGKALSASFRWVSRSCPKARRPGASRRELHAPRLGLDAGRGLDAWDPRREQRSVVEDVYPETGLSELVQGDGGEASVGG